MEGIKKEDFFIKEISKTLANDIVIRHHYLHRRPQNKYSFGLFNKKGDIVGVIIYGIPASRSLQIGICGEEYANEVIELTRLWVDDKVGKNGESFLIGNTIKRVKEKIIVSYAERRMGHVGKVYQSTNWIYTGLSTKMNDWKIKGMDSRHIRHLWDKYGGINEAKKILGDKMISVPRPRKHRYIYFNCNKKEKKEFLKHLRYSILPYPKGEEENQIRKTIDCPFNTLDGESIFDL